MHPFEVFATFALGFAAGAIVTAAFLHLMGKRAERQDSTGPTVTPRGGGGPGEE